MSIRLQERLWSVYLCGLRTNHYKQHRRERSVESVYNLHYHSRTVCTTHAHIHTYTHTTPHHTTTQQLWVGGENKRWITSRKMGTMLWYMVHETLPKGHSPHPHSAWIRIPLFLSSFKLTGMAPGTSARCILVLALVNRGHLRPSESIDIYITTHNSSKIAVRK